MKLQGTITALITPFIHQKLDLQGLIKNIGHQISSGVNGILLLGTTGEGSTLTPQEKAQVIAAAVHEAKGKVPILVGTGSNSTHQTIENTLQAKSLGADGALVVTPYYNRPTQEGIYRHFEALTEAVDFPIILYNIPSRCGTNIDTHTVLRIAALPNIIGIKEASGSVSQAADILAASSQFPNFKLFSGDDALTIPMMALGAAGIISVVSNLVPKEMVAMTKAALQGDFEEARKMHFEWLPLFKAAFIETNPIPIKALMEICGMPAGSCRLPLYQMAEENLNKLRHQLKKMHLIPQ